MKPCNKRRHKTEVTFKNAAYRKRMVRVVRGHWTGREGFVDVYGGCQETAGVELEATHSWHHGGHSCCGGRTEPAKKVSIRWRDLEFAHCCK